MPIYQYRCLNCGLQFELKQRFDDKPIADCPSCRGISRRLFSPVPVIFNGPGFYVTDSRQENDRRSKPTVSAKDDERKGNGGGES